VSVSWQTPSIHSDTMVVVNSGRIQEMQVHEVAMDLGVTPDTVRYYTRAGLLEPADKGESPCQLVRQLIEDRLVDVNKRWLKWIR
jgi:hypothetical protein